MPNRVCLLRDDSELILTKSWKLQEPHSLEEHLGPTCPMAFELSRTGRSSCLPK
jgi:hypothetical protein